MENRIIVRVNGVTYCTSQLPLELCVKIYELIADYEKRSTKAPVREVDYYGV